MVERIQAHEFETLGHHVERLVVGFGAQGHLVSANLQGGKWNGSSRIMKKSDEEQFLKTVTLRQIVGGAR